MKKRLLVALFAAMGWSGAAFASLPTPPAQLTQDAQALSAMANTWPVLQSAAQSYGQLAPYATAEWAGPGPVVTNSMNFREQCHNSRWDSLTQNLVTGGLNIGGDAEAEAYAIQAVAVDYPQQLSNYLLQLVQSGNPQASALANQLMAQKGPLLASLNSLTTLLNTTSQQLENAIGPNSTLAPLPISNWQAGIGDAPDLEESHYLKGPNDGAPIGWFGGLIPDSPIAHLADICPTGTASLPMLALQSQVLQAAQQAVQDEPALGQEVQPLENGSTWTVPGPFGAGGAIGLGIPTNSTRQQLVSALATDENGIAGYMEPISASLAQYNQDVQQIQQEIATAGN